MRSKSVSLSSEIISNKAKQFAKQLGCDDFKTTDKYISGLKKRHNIVLAKMSGESASVNEEKVIQWANELKTYLSDYKPEDVYNLDETGLFYRLLPSKTYAFADEKRYGNKKSKIRVTLTLITNADGSDKSASIIGKSQRPLALRGKNPPIDYYSQENSWMDAVVYNQVVSKLNQQMKRQKRKILIFVDNFSGHILLIKNSQTFVLNSCRQTLHQYYR